MPASDDPRIGDLLGRRLAPAAVPTVVLIGFPVDEGVRRNGGRPGAAGAPGAVREAFFRLTPGDAAMRELIGRTRDAGDMVSGGGLEAAQERLGRTVGEWLARGAIPIVIGGGHETAYGHFLGYVGARRAVSILNIDAHADVRPMKGDQGHSGSPFRQAILHPSRLCRKYVVAGLLPHAVATAHARFVREHGGECHWRADVGHDALRAIVGGLDAPVMASFDLDAVDSSQAPGVSAPATGGLSADLWLQAAWLAGRSPATTSMDVVEVNPVFDIDGRTARLAALTIWIFLKGIAERPASADPEPGRT